MTDPRQDPDKPWIVTPKPKPTCPGCGATNLVTMPSLNRKYCPECDRNIGWVKDAGQPDYY